MTARLERIPPKGRRANIIRAALDADLTMSAIVRSVRTVAPMRRLDPAIDRLKTHAAVRDLRGSGFLTRTPRGYRATSAGVALLRASESHHG